MSLDGRAGGAPPNGSPWTCGAQIGAAVDQFAVFVEGVALWIGVPAWTVLGTVLILLLTLLQSSSKPRVPKFTGDHTPDDKARQRQRITKLRATSKLFTPPYPNGWYCLCRSSDLTPGDVLPLTAFGRELVCFRGKRDHQATFTWRRGE